MQKIADVLPPAGILLGALAVPMIFSDLPFAIQVIFGGIAGAAALSVLSIATMLIIQNRQAKLAPAELETECRPVVVPQEVMIAAYDRSAGRWCDDCKMHGSHHTERHDEFAAGARAMHIAHDY